MKKEFLLSLVLILIIIGTSSVSASSVNIAGPGFDINQLKYDPYPAEPGEYMNLWVEVYNIGTESAEDVVFELVPEYPFSLDPNEAAVREFKKVPGLFHTILQYKVRVDSKALDGWNDIKIRYKMGDSNWIEKETEIYVDEAANEAELEPLFVSSSPKPYPGGETTLKVDVANIAPGSAYYTIVEADVDFATIEVNKIFIGTLDADDFDTVEFEMKISENIPPGEYPVKINSYYKNEDYEKTSSNKTIYMNIYSEEEARADLIQETPWYMYLIYLVIAVVIIKYFLYPRGKKLLSKFRSKK